ncbi:MAG: GAF domain-containing SpoIIE family protein phosphatase [Opitutales bacterium]
MITFICIFLSVFFVLFIVPHYFIVRRQWQDLLRENDELREDKVLIVNVMRRFALEFQGGVSLLEICKKAIHLSATSVNAQSSCIYLKQASGTWMSAGTQGLFPPQKRSSKLKGDESTKAERMEKIYEGEILDANEGLVGEVGSEGKSILISDATKDPRIIKSDDPSLNITSAIYMPIRVDGEVIAVMVVLNPMGENLFGEMEVSILKTLAEQAGIAISNANAVDQFVERNKLTFDLKLAGGVQKYLLPQQMPVLEDYEFAVRYVPQQSIGGDFYDFIELPKSKLGIVIADVSGKGVSAAMVMAIVQTKLKSIAKNYETPAEALKALNREIAPILREDMFITMIYAILDINKGEITMARAGHEQALLCAKYTSESPSMKINSAGMAVGMVDPEIFDMVIEDTIFPFGKDSVLVMYTDGITESLNANKEEFGSNRLEKSIKRFAQKSAIDINTDILLDVQKFCGATYSYADDMTLLIIKHKVASNN